MSFGKFMNELFSAVFNRSNMQGFLTLWVVGLFTYVFIENMDDEQYKVLLIGTVSLATGVYLGKQTNGSGDSQ